MLKPAHIETFKYFYATGNTPAVCLSQSVPHGQDASLLLLGCGDVRSILFTAYCRSASDAGKLDVTCCDNQTEIIARNIILYTLLLDDHDGQNTKLLWRVYYHIMLDTKSLDILRTQAQKLGSLATSFKEWHQGPYGKLLRFCDTVTFTRVARLWEFYALSPSHGKAFQEQQDQLKAYFERAREMYKMETEGGLVFSSLRSTAPCLVLAVKDSSLLKSTSEFWKSGVTLVDGQELVDCKHLNPMFGGPHQTMILHYGTDPLLGFHLATGYAPLTKNSPLRPSPSKRRGLEAATQAAVSEFRAWAESFRRVRERLVIRFVAADALSLCHFLQHHRVHKDSTGPSWYRDRWHYEPLVLDSEDYASQGGAPTAFDVIDTSNLVDHLGSLNILAACAPLLAPHASSAIYTEILVLRDESIEAYMKKILCGDLATVSLLFGLRPVQYWTNTTTSSNFEESMLGMFSETNSLTQCRYVVVWKKAALPFVQFNSKELASFVYNMYLQMFQDESWANLWSASAVKLFRKQYEEHTRASLAVILRLIKNAQLVPWDTFVEILWAQLLEDRKLNMGAHYIQELYLHMHLFGLRTPMAYEHGMGGLRKNLDNSPLRSWQTIPSTVCLTIVVPHHKLGIFQKSPAQFGSPICHIMLQSPDDGRQNIFPDVQLGFGDVRTTGTRNTDNYAVHVKADEQEWHGKSPLIVSTLVPTWVVLHRADLSTEVIFALKSSPTSMMLAKELGMFLDIHKSRLASKDVYITLHPPNLEGYMSTSCSRKTCSSVPSLSLIRPSDFQATKASFHASLDGTATKISKLNIHLDLSSTEGQNLLRAGAAVTVNQVSPFRVEFDIGTGLFRESIQLPLPLVMSGGKTRIARKSSYVEFAASVASPASLYARTDSTFPIHLREGSPILENLHYVQLDCLPTLDLTKGSDLGWMTTHLSTMWSEKERTERDRCRSLGTTCQDVHVNFKDSLLSIFSHVAGIGGTRQHTIFGIKDRAGGGFHLLIFASSVRLDLASQSITLDAALLPLTVSLAPLLTDFLSSLHKRGIVSILVDDAELLLWKHVTPAFIERCRVWEHVPSCEYAAHGASVPLSVKFGEQFVCSCGMGRFPEDYKPDVPLWNRLAKYCVRAALSPCFSVPFVDKSLDLRSLATQGAAKEATGRMAGLDLNSEACFTYYGETPSSQSL